MTVPGFRPALRSVREDDRWCTPSLIDYDAADGIRKAVIPAGERPARGQPASR